MGENARGIMEKFTEGTKGGEAAFGKIIRRPDFSYVIRGGTYHVPNEGGFEELWAEVEAYARAFPEMVEDEAPPPPPTEEDERAARRASILAQLEETDRQSIRPLRAGEVERLAELDERAAGLRAELAALAAAETEG